MSDKDRIQMVMDHYQMNNASFCAKVGLNQATLSNILCGRTNPSLTVLRSIIEAFPDLNPNWVFVGADEMFKSDTPKPTTPQSIDEVTSSDLFGGTDQALQDDLFSAMASMSTPGASVQPSSAPSQQRPPAPSSKVPPISVGEIVSGVVSQLQKPQRKIKEVRIFFDDGTYEVFS